MRTPLALALVVLSDLARAADVPVLPNVTLTASEVINLWPGVAPGETGAVGHEHILENRPRPFDQITDVTVPTLSVFLPPADQRTGTGILVIPGGGLERLAIEHEGYEVAAWLNEHGIAAFLLKYRVPPRDPDQRWKAGLQDAQRAMGLIRAHADAWQVDRDAIGSIGFSAGGEINVRLALGDSTRDYKPVDDADTFSTRPDFNIPIYAGGFADFRANALRDDLAKRINAQTPPMFIVHAFDDAALTSIILMNELKRANDASELHIFGAGAHGFGVRETGLPLNAWRDLCLHWLDWQGYLDAPGVRTFARDYVSAYTGGARSVPRFDAVVPHATIADAFAAQRRVVLAAVAGGSTITGYKGASTTAAAQSSRGLSGPLFGVLFKEGRIEARDDVPVKVDANRPISVETEIGYVIGVDIATKLLTPRQAITTIESVMPAIELPDNIGALSGGTMTVLDSVAANIGSHRFIVGAPVDPKTVANLDAVAVTLQHDGATLYKSSGADANGGQAKNLMALINIIVDQGHVIHHGDIIISGSLGGAHPGATGHYRADYGALGVITFSLE